MSVDAAAGRNILKPLDLLNLQEYASHPLVHDTNRHFAEKYEECSRTGAFIGLTEIELRVKDFVRRQTVYSLKQEEEGEK